MKVRVRALRPDAEHPTIHWHMPKSLLVSIDPVNETAIVEVPDEDLPPGWHTGTGLETADTFYGPVVIRADEKATRAWLARLKRRYPGSALIPEEGIV